MANKRITNEVLAERIDNLKADVQDIKVCVETFNELKTQVAVNTDRQKFWNVGLAVLNVTIGAIATTIGLRR